jgi:proteasome maturation protein
LQLEQKNFLKKIDAENVDVGNELREVPDFHTEMETKMKMNW